MHNNIQNILANNAEIHRQEDFYIFILDAIKVFYIKKKHLTNTHA